MQVCVHTLTAFSILLSPPPPLLHSLMQDLQLITLPESKYVHAVKRKGEYVLASNGDLSPDSIFAIERYTNTQSSSPSYYYRLRRKGTKDYLYIEDDRLLLGVSKQTHDTHKNTPINAQSLITHYVREEIQSKMPPHTHTCTNTCTKPHRHKATLYYNVCMYLQTQVIILKY